MDSHTLLDKFKGGKRFFWTAAKLACAFAAVGVVVYGAPRWVKKGGHGTASNQFVAQAYETLHDAIDSVQHKADRLATAERENEQLRLENLNLRLAADTAVFDCRVKEGAARAEEIGLKLSKETGAKVGRSLASIYYRPPTHLLPSQLYTLGVSYFKAREDEKSAVIMTFLTGLDDNDAFKTAKNFLLTGVAWYRLENYDLADAYFDRTLQIKENPEASPYLAQARLWRALTAEKTGKHSQSQRWLRELVDNHPYSTEATWVNSQEVGRAPSGHEAE